MAAAAAYEAKRRRQIEENKRRIEELGLRQLAAAAIPPQAKRPKHKARVPGAADTAPPRRSGRVANLPEQPEYREKIMKKRVIGMTAVERSYAIAKAKAKELECKLGANYPTFVKTITQSSATSFCLSLPPQFFREHLPEHVKVITLVDEEDDEFEVQYHKTPRDHHYYMTRWKWFAINHKLDAGDCLVFQLIEQTKFKVYIMRARSYLEKMTIKTESF
ncbi:hypothetical protein HU200_035117 [Digitaria exilis]|uniref:TF-B3 domain-containing protein n=1 Tax=Digitaria exilis TaxID=1010633 RepID=A0A835ENG5_9POAL|nr:hypothetical protein HU200_035117 [Digitaria exilis]